MDMSRSTPKGHGPASDASVVGSNEWFAPRLAWYAVGMVAAVTVFGQLDRGIMALLVVEIQRDTQMSDTQISLLLGLAYSLAYMSMGLPMARVADAGRRTLILPSALAVWSMGTAFCGAAQNFVQFFAARMLVGGGESVKAPTSASLIPDLVPRDKLPRAFGIYQMAIMGGEALAMIIGGLLLGLVMKMPPVHLPLIGDAHGWRLVFFLFGLPGVALALLFLSTVPEPKRHGRRRQGSAPIKDVALFLLKGPESRVILPVIIAAAVAGIYAFGVGAWRPTFYERTYGLSPHEYGPLYGLVSLVCTPIGALLGTFLAERMSRRWDDAQMRLVTLAYLFGMPIGIAAPLMPTFHLALACQGAWVILLMISSSCKLAAMQIIIPNEMRSQVNAVYMFTVGVVGMGIGPTVVALVTDYVFKSEAELRYAMVTVAAVAAPLITLCLWRTIKPFGQLHRQVIERERAAASLPAP